MATMTVKRDAGSADSFLQLTDVLTADIRICSCVSFSTLALREIQRRSGRDKRVRERAVVFVE